MTFCQVTKRYGDTVFQRKLHTLPGKRRAPVGPSLYAAAAHRRE
jgi:hypothetical protein